MDVLSEILASMRLVSSVISRARFTAPWAVRTQGAQGAIFHAVLEGRCVLVDGPTGARFDLARGDLVLLAHGGAHTVASASGVPEVPVAALPVGPDRSVAWGGGGDATAVLCGSFRLDHSGGAALLSALPPVALVARGHGEVVAWFDTTLRLVDEVARRGEPGADAVVARLLDVLFVQLLRGVAASLPEAATGWLAAAQHPQIGRALALIHTSPGAAWTATALARKVGMSRSSFFTYFTSLVGESPARYLARWRALTAAERLRRTDVDVATLADELGYETAGAFTRAFKRHTGMTPRALREALAAGVDATRLGVLPDVAARRPTTH